MAKKYLHIGKILKRLLFDNNMKSVDLARKVNIPPPTIHRLITGKSTRPYKSSLQPIADYFSIKLEQLLGEEPLENNKESNHLLFSKVRYIPLIPWNNLESLEPINNNMVEKIAFTGKISDNCYATILQDSSMEPIFPRESLLIFDLEREPKDRSYVLVELHDSNLFVFRQLLVDVDQKYLKPLNPDLHTFKMRLLRKEDKIIATLVEARQVYNEY